MILRFLSAMSQQSVELSTKKTASSHVEQAILESRYIHYITTTNTVFTGSIDANLSLFICVVQSWRLLEMLKQFTITIRVALGNSSSFISASKETSREGRSQTVSSTETCICVPNGFALFGCVQLCMCVLFLLKMTRFVAYVRCELLV